MELRQQRPSPRIPAKYVDWAGRREIVVVAGANQALKYWRRINAGLGTEARPFQGTQSIDAAVALLALTGADERTLYAWGYGAAVDPARTYFYQHATGRTIRLRFLSVARMANAFNYSENEARSAARQLTRDVADSQVVDPANTMFVGCSWGAAVIDYAMTHGARHAIRLPGPAVAIGGPRALPSWRWPQLLGLCPLSNNGDHGSVWVQRHPDDPIGAHGVKPMFYLMNRRFHDYRPRSSGSPAGSERFWGISG
jgi:hypothetical protein